MIICFVHCPRTGGAATIRYLRENGHYPNSTWMGDGDGRPLVIGKDTVGLGEEWKKNFAKLYDLSKNYFSAGHFPYGINDYLQYDNFYYISIVRDPVKRVWSRYNTFRNAIPVKHHVASTLWQERYNFNIRRILDAGEPELCNDQVRLISGSDKVIMTEENLERAIYNVSNEFSYVTCTERLRQYFLNELHDVIPEIKPGTMNQTHNRISYNAIGDAPSKDIRNYILEHNQLDTKLYEYVRDREKVGKFFEK